jgi:hypothetical protein
MVSFVPARQPQPKDDRAQLALALARRWIAEGAECAGFYALRATPSRNEGTFTV